MRSRATRSPQQGRGWERRRPFWLAASARCLSCQRKKARTEGGRSVAGGRSAANLCGDKAEEGDDGRPAADGRSVRGQTGKGSGGPVACCPGDAARHGPHGTPNTVVEWGERKEGLAGLAASPRGRMNKGGASYDLAVQRKGKGSRQAGDRLRTGGGQVGQAVGGGACEPGEKPKGSRAPARRPARAGEGVEIGNGQKGAAGRGGTGRVNELGFGRFFELIIYDVGTSGSGVARLLFSCRVRPPGVLGGGPRPV